MPVFLHKQIIKIFPVMKEVQVVRTAVTRVIDQIAALLRMLRRLLA